MIVIALVKELGGTVKIPSDLVCGIPSGTSLELGVNTGGGYFSLRVTETSDGGIIIP